MPDPATRGARHVDLRRPDRPGGGGARGSGCGERQRVGLLGHVHTTRPQTAGYGLVDSPVALCAWILEKFWSWTDHGGNLYDVISRNQILDNLTIYWVTATGASSARLYWESSRRSTTSSTPTSPT